MKKSTLVVLFVIVGIVVAIIIGSSIKSASVEKEILNPITSENTEETGVASSVDIEKVTDIPVVSYTEGLLNEAIKNREQEGSENEEVDSVKSEQSIESNEISDTVEPIVSSKPEASNDSVSSPEQPIQSTDSNTELPAEEIINDKKIELTSSLYKDFLLEDFTVTSLTAKSGVSLGKLKQDAAVVFKWSEGYCVGDSRNTAVVLLPSVTNNYSTAEEAFENAKVLQANISLVVPEFFYKDALNNETDRFSILLCVDEKYYEIQFTAIITSVGAVFENEENANNTPMTTPSATEDTNRIENEKTDEAPKKESIYPTVDYTTVVHGVGIVLANDEYVATASGHCVGLTMRENAKYVLATQSSYYCLKYTAVEWDGYLLQDVSVGDSFNSYEEALKASDKVPSGVNMYLPLNVDGISSMKEFDAAADDIRLLIIEGDNVSEVSYADFIS